MIIMPDADLDCCQCIDGAAMAVPASGVWRSLSQSPPKETANALMERLIPQISAQNWKWNGTWSGYGAIVQKSTETRLQRMWIAESSKSWVTVDGRGLWPVTKMVSSSEVLLDQVTPEMEIYKNEIFGPVLSTVRVDSTKLSLNWPTITLWERYRYLH